MKKSYFLLALITLLLSCKEPQKTPELSQELTDIHNHLDNYFTALTTLGKFNGVLLAYKNDTLVLEKAYNMHSNPEHSAYVTINNQFDIHSVSKLMAHYLIIKLASENRLSKDQTIDHFYPDFPNGYKITIDMLLHHRSGLPRELQDFEGSEFDLSSNDIVSLAKKQNLLFEPGTDAQYSNVGYEIVYNIISKLYKKPFTQCLTDHVFTPLHMNNSGAHFFTNKNQPENLAKNHVLKDSVMTKVPNILTDEFKTARVFSTLSDLHLFLNEISHQPYQSELKDSKDIIAKDGGSKGIRAQVYKDFKHHFSYVLLANYDNMPFFKTIENLAKMLQSEPVALPKPIHRKAITLEKAVLERYVGTYEFEDFDGLLLRVAVEGDHLIIFQEDEKIGTLKPESETVFFENPKDAESFEFVKNDSGTYDALMGWKGISVPGKRQ